MHWDTTAGENPFVPLSQLTGTTTPQINAEKRNPPKQSRKYEKEKSLRKKPCVFLHEQIGLGFRSQPDHQF